MKADVIPLMTWERVREEYSKLQQMGWQWVQQGMRIGDMLNDLKGRTRQRSGEPSFAELSETHGIPHRTANTLMQLARNRLLLEQHKPPSQAKALALIPKKKKTANTEAASVAVVAHEDEEEQRPMTQRDHHNDFWARVSTAGEFGRQGFNARKASKEMVAEARAVAAIWTELAQKMEKLL